MRVLVAAITALYALSAAAEFPESFEATLVVADSQSIDVAMHVDDISPTFQFIPGEIFGPPNEEVVLPISIGEDSVLSAPLAEWRELASAASLPLSKKYSELGLQIEPSDTKLSRMATFAHDAVHNAEIGAYLDELGKDHLLILVYVDRPCKISGEILVHGQRYNHDIELSRGGFHYLAADDAGLIKDTEVAGKVLFVVPH